MRLFGEIEGIKEGDVFESRRALNIVGLHGPLQAGISGSQFEGADSIVLSGGYIDDIDLGDVIIYTGEGGRDPITGRQSSDQNLISANMALAISCEESLPIRVIRGSTHKSIWSPFVGYIYSGLYMITQYWPEIGKDGFRIWRYKLIKISSSELIEFSSIGTLPDRMQVVSNRIVRNFAISKSIKNLYGHSCQICGNSIKTPTGLYSEAAHIRPLGSPHNGFDHESNMLCLCPNHHKMLDFHAFSIQDDMRLLGIEGILRVKKEHRLSNEVLKYHRNQYNLFY